MFLFVCLQFCGCSTDNIGVFGTVGCKTLAIMLICIGDGIRDSLFITTVARGFAAGINKKMQKSF